MTEDNFIYLFNNTTFKYLLENDKTKFFSKELIKHFTKLELDDFTLFDEKIVKASGLLLINKSKDTILNIEFNLLGEVDIDNKNKDYLLELNSHFNTNSQHKRIIQLNFNSFISESDEDIMVDSYDYYAKTDNQEIVKIGVYNVFIPTIINSSKDKALKDKLKLIYSDSYSEMEDVCSSDDRLKIIIEVLKDLSKDDNFIKQYNLENDVRFLKHEIAELSLTHGYNSGLVDGLSTGLCAGKKLGENEKAKEIAIKLIKDGYGIGTISRLTNLKKDKITKLKSCENKE